MPVLFPLARLCAGLPLALALGAHAHVTLDAAPAQAGATLKASFRLGQGCGASPTASLSSPAVLMDVGAPARHPAHHH